MNFSDRDVEYNSPLPSFQKEQQRLTNQAEETSNRLFTSSSSKLRLDDEAHNKCYHDENVANKKEVVSLSWDDVVLQELLGIGTFNQVHAATIKRRYNNVSPREQNTYAIKCPRQDILNTEDKEVIQDAKEDLKMEGILLTKLRGHPNIIHLYCISAEKKSLEDARGSFLLMERLSGGTIEESLRRCKFDSTVQRRQRQLQIGVSIAHALEYLHSQNIIFRDLKPSNIGYDVHDNIKLFDFGLARELPKGEYGKTYRLTQQTGTPRYMSPECYNGNNYGLPVDVYSFGLLLWELGTLKKPYRNMVMSDMVRRVYNGTTRPKLDAKSGCKQMRKLIKSCWDTDPSARPLFSDIRPMLEELASDSTLAAPTKANTQSRRRNRFQRRSTY